MRRKVLTCKDIDFFFFFFSFPLATYLFIGDNVISSEML